MTTETFDQFADWIVRNKSHFGIEFRRMVPYFTSETASFLRLEYPSTPGKVAYTANLCATLSSMYYDRAHFDGATLWFTDAPFNNWEHTGGQATIDRIRAGFGDLRPFSWEHVYQFRADEIGLLTTFIILGIVLAWDFYILTGRADHMVHCSHDAFCGVFAKDAEAAEYLRSSFKGIFTS